ncbi:MAG: hypothetical protein KDG53_18970, partial [Rhodocyclaceae bacterium]|nr:hypothetical protein [Rhodocyclaceae bacterium]
MPEPLARQIERLGLSPSSAGAGVGIGRSGNYGPDRVAIIAFSSSRPAPVSKLPPLTTNSFPSGVRATTKMRLRIDNDVIAYQDPSQRTTAKGA